MLQDMKVILFYLGKIDIGLDCASSEFYVPEKNLYDLDFKGKEGDKKLITK